MSSRNWATKGQKCGIHMVHLKHYYFSLIKNRSSLFKLFAAMKKSTRHKENVHSTQWIANTCLIIFKLQNNSTGAMSTNVTVCLSVTWSSVPNEHYFLTVPTHSISGLSCHATESYWSSISHNEDELFLRRRTSDSAEVVPQPQPTKRLHSNLLNWSQW